MTSAVNECEAYRKTTRREELLPRMDTPMPQAGFCPVTESSYPVVGNGADLPGYGLLTTLSHVDTRNQANLLQSLKKYSQPCPINPFVRIQQTPAHCHPDHGKTKPVDRIC